MTENNQMQPSSKPSFFFGFFVGLAVFSLIGFLSLSFMFRKGDTQTLDEQKNQQISQQEQENESPVEALGPKIVGSIGTFAKIDQELCEEDGRPVIRLFSTTNCPHCTWIKDTFDKVVKEYVDQGKIKAHHWELDQENDILTEEDEGGVPDLEIEVLTKVNPQGYVPAFVFGCQYVRIGTGYEKEDDLEKEAEEFREIIDELLK